MIPSDWELHTRFNPDLAAPAAPASHRRGAGASSFGRKIVTCQSASGTPTTVASAFPYLPEKVFLQFNFASHLLPMNK